MVEIDFGAPLTATLPGALVTLEPLAEEHRDGLWEAAQADEIWAWLPRLHAGRESFDAGSAATPATDGAGEGSRPGTGACAGRRTADGVLVGSSRYLNVRR